MDKKIFAFLAWALKTSEDELTGKLPKSAEGEDLDIEKSIPVLKTMIDDRFKKVISDGTARMTATAKKALDKEIREQFGTDSKSEGLALIQEVMDTKVSEATENKADALTKENALKNPIVKEILADKLKSASEAFETKEQGYASKIKELEGKELTSTKRTKALEYFKSKKANFYDKDGQVDQKKLNTLYKLIDLEQFDGELKPLDGDTPRMRENGYEPMTFEDVMDDINPFGYLDADPSKSTPPPPSGGKSGDKDAPKTQADLMKIVNDPKVSIENKRAASDAFREAQKATE